MNFNDLFSDNILTDLEFFHYKGSLTFPPCTETVNWFVYHKVLAVKESDMKVFNEKWVKNHEFCPAGTGNSRPVCDLHDRKIFKIKAETQ